MEGLLLFSGILARPALGYESREPEWLGASRIIENADHHPIPGNGYLYTSRFVEEQVFASPRLPTWKRGKAEGGDAAGQWRYARCSDPHRRKRDHVCGKNGLAPAHSLSTLSFRPLFLFLVGLLLRSTALLH